MASGNPPTGPDANRLEGCCPHSGYYSAMGRYSRDSRTLRYVLVCDDCGQEVKELSALEYVPNPVIVAV
jgi:hypothetical protein